MPYTLKIAVKDVFGKGKFKSSAGKTECAEFVRQATGAGPTTTWKKGDKVVDQKPGGIPTGTAIATFDDAGRYPTDALGKHAAIYLSHSKQGIEVLDQWNSQGEVKKRTIKCGCKPNTKRSNNGDTFYVIK